MQYFEFTRWVNQMRTPNVAMIAAACGFDAVYIDLEHNPTSLETAAAICVAALGIGLTPIARVSSRDAHDATRILDCGAQGVMVPHVSTVTEAKAVVESCRYLPQGHRSASGSGPSLGYAARSQGEITFMNSSCSVSLTSLRSLVKCRKRHGQIPSSFAACSALRMRAPVSGMTTSNAVSAASCSGAKITHFDQKKDWLIASEG